MRISLFISISLILYGFQIRSLHAKSLGDIYGFTGVQIPKQQLRFTTLDASENKNQEFLLDPNPKKNLTFSIHLKKFSLFLGLPIIGEDLGVNGKSKSVDLRFKSKFRQFLPRFYYQKYRGFELKDELNNSKRLGFLTEVETLNYGLSLSTYLSRPFTSSHSGHAFFERMKKNLKEGWSWDRSYLYSLGYNYLKISGLPPTNDALSSLSGESRIQTLTTNFGATYQAFYGPITLEGTLALGPGFSRYRSLNNVNKSKLVLNGDLELLIAYKIFSNYFLLTHFDINFITGKIEGTELSNNMISLDVSLGKSF